MFTGIIETIGSVSEIKSKGNYKLFKIKPGIPFENIIQGESISVDGCCLTVTKFSRSDFTVEASQETLKLSVADSYRVNHKVNLERALLPVNRMGGHIVTGHVDCLGNVAGIKKIDKSIELLIKYPMQFNSLLVEKGSIAVNGISLTVNELKDDKFTVNIIPFTQTGTTMRSFITGQKINLEFDILAKYVGKLLNKNKKLSEENKVITIDRLIENGW